MLKKIKENKKGFTLAELLIVVAIIAVLVAISIPIFSSQLEKSERPLTLLIFVQHTLSALQQFLLMIVKLVITKRFLLSSRKMAGIQSQIKLQVH